MEMHVGSYRVLVAIVDLAELLRSVLSLSGEVDKSSFHKTPSFLIFSHSVP